MKVKETVGAVNCSKYPGLYTYEPCPMPTGALHPSVGQITERQVDTGSRILALDGWSVSSGYSRRSSLASPGQAKDIAS